MLATLTTTLVVGGAGIGTFLLVPVIGGTVLGVIGFTSSGITAGSTAASMMSASAIANGGGVAAGGMVAALQTAGAAGVGPAASAAVGAVGSGVAAIAAILF